MTVLLKLRSIFYYLSLDNPEEVRQAISELSRELSTNEIALFSIVLSAKFQV